MKTEIEKQAFDWPTILQYMGGGALLGGGTAATAALVRLLLNLNEEKNKGSDTSLDDSTLYINLKGTGKKQKKVEKEASKKCKGGEYYCPEDKVCKKEKDRIEKKSFEKEAIFGLFEQTPELKALADRAEEAREDMEKKKSFDIASLFGGGVKRQEDLIRDMVWDATKYGPENVEKHGLDTPENILNFIRDPEMGMEEVLEHMSEEELAALIQQAVEANLEGPHAPKEAHVKEAIDSDTATLSFLGMALAAYLGYSGVNKVFNRVREKRLQKELDLAQQVYIDKISGPPVDDIKSASVKSAISRPTFAMTVAKALPLLIALGTAVAAYRVLDKHSPLPKKTGVKPKRIVLRSNNKRTEDSIPEDTSSDDVEHLIRATMAKESRANANGMHDLVTYVSNGGLTAFKSNFKNYGMDTALTMIKGARQDGGSALSKNLAIRVVSTDELLKPSVGLLAASEFYDMSPGIMKSAQAIPEDVQEALLKSSRELLNKETSNIYKPVLDELKSQVGEDKFKELLQKEALVSEVSYIYSLNRLMSKDDKEDNPDKNVVNSGKLQVPNSESSDDKIFNDEKTAKKTISMQVEGEEAKKFWTKNKDIIDEALGFA